ncbi:MAG: antibiotic biosynthesis monooxygenase [Thiohalocapsa sp.]|nr:antibiotic biosynthesis monooxygenase [Thiohalocapsa sp.]MCF7990122.1 antibiotic biosynthesis monooxygenase [Thiohalocapsa sp.]
MDNRSAPVVDVDLTEANGTAEPESALRMLARSAPKANSLAADKSYGTAAFIRACRDRSVISRVAAKRKGSALDARTTRHETHRVSLRMRNPMEEVFGWLKTVAGPRKARYRSSASASCLFSRARSVATPRAPRGPMPPTELLVERSTRTLSAHQHLGYAMFIAMNRFRIALGSEDEFVSIWKNRDSHLSSVPGFKSFNLLRGPTTEEYTLFVSHSIWESAAAFEAWTKSEAFRKAHANAGDAKPAYLGPPEFEGFESVL